MSKNEDYLAAMQPQTQIDLRKKLIRRVTRFVDKYVCLTCMMLFLLSSSYANASTKESRVALVVGNSNYLNNPLKNPVNDATDIAHALREYGFSVLEKNNLTTRQIGATLREFRNLIKPGSVVVFFYAGHGLTVRGENYLPAVDAQIDSEEDVPTQSLSTKQIMEILEDAKSRVNIVFLDACRDNPFTRKFRSFNRGLSRESAPAGTLISFATRPGQVAADGDGRNGLYTGVLLRQIQNGNQPIELLLKQVVSGVRSISNGKQEPWMEGSIDGDFCFSYCNSVLASDKLANQSINLQIANLLAQTKTAYKDQRYTDVINISRSILLLNPKETSALTNMSIALYMQGDAAEAIKLNTEAISINPQLGSAFNNRAAIHEAIGNRIPALNDYKRGCDLKSVTSCQNLERLSRKP